MFFPLLFNPGIVLYLNEFIEFLKTEKRLRVSENEEEVKSDSDPWEIHDQFKQYLGYETFYRAMAIGDSETIEFIKKNGILSRKYRNDQSLDEIKDSLQHEYTKKINVKKNTYLISITKYPQVANLVALRYVNSSKNINIRIINYKLKVPKLDVLFPLKDKRSLLQLRNKETLVHPNVESFLFGFIPPEEIQDLEYYDPKSLCEHLMTKKQAIEALEYQKDHKTYGAKTEYQYALKSLKICSDLLKSQ